jgi:allantoinase
MRYFERSPFVPITERPKLNWPNGARLAVWVVPNIEYWYEDSFVGGTIVGPPKELPDIANYTWRDYGLRVGIWRMMDVLAGLDIPATVALNSLVCDYYPQVVAAGVKLGWEFMGHGRTNSERLSGLNEADERAYIREVLDRIAKATGTSVRGWLGQGLSETVRTPDILAEFGADYVADWVNDEQPAPLKTTSRDLIALPYSSEVNDIPIVLGRGQSGPELEHIIRTQFDVLYRESAQTAKVMCIALHPYLTGVPFRSHHLEAALRYMREKPDVWFATGSAIVDAYRVATGTGSAK